jgi:hypothetical protein
MSEKKSLKDLKKDALHEKLLSEIEPEAEGGFKSVDLEFSNKPYENDVSIGRRARDLEFTSVSDKAVKINGVEFVPHPETGFKSDVEHKPVQYKYDYRRIAQLIASKEWPEIAYRELIWSDLWFVLFFIVKPFSDDLSRAKANCPFVIRACQEVEEGPKDYTLDIWARFHFKSSIVTIAETIQYELKNPNHATGIFSHKSPIAKDFLFSIREIFQNEKILAVTHPDVVWADCKREAPLWSLDEGIILKRDTNRKEASVSAHGLSEGMPTALHFERRVYDDITTNDIAQSMDIILKVQHAFDVSQNLKTLVGSSHRVVGTYYSHNDPLVYVRDKKDLDGKFKYYLRFKPATEDGTAIGKPVLMSQEALDELKGDTSFNCQQLLDPTPSADQRLNPDFLQKIEPGSIPKDVYKFLLIDQAGDAESNKSRNTDAWAMCVFGVEPFSDEIGQSRIFIQDLWVEVCGESEAIERAVRMYVDAGIVCSIGVEKVGQTTTHLHIANALKARGRHVEFSDDRWSSGILLRPSGRNKKKFIESALAWPLNNSKWFYSSEVPVKYIERLKQEMSTFPLWHDDTLNACAYLYDVIREYNFPLRKTKEELEKMRLLELTEKEYNPLVWGLKVSTERGGYDPGYDPLKF